MFLLPPVVANLGAADLAAAAAASSRPAECRVATPSHGLWQAARQPELGRYCRLLARGHALLGRSPASALLAAEQAERVLATRAAPALLAGRALWALGRPKDAHDRFLVARSRAPGSLETPEVLHAFAASSLRAGQGEHAHSAYRSLVPRVGLLSDRVARQRAYLEASLVLMHEGAIGEAVGALTEARRREVVPGLSELVAGALALALDRQGRREEARGVAAEAGAPSWLLALAEQPSARADVTAALVEGELWAIAAMVATFVEGDSAREAWRRYLASPAVKNVALRKHAEERLRLLSQPARRR